MEPIQSLSIFALFILTALTAAAIPVAVYLDREDDENE
jgi:hypothetical protein